MYKDMKFAIARPTTAYLQKKPPYSTTNCGLVNVFSGIKASPEQHNLMNFRKIGDDHLRSFIAYHILKQPITNAPVRIGFLQWQFGIKVSKWFINQKEKEMKQVTKCLRQRLAWCNRTGQPWLSSQRI